MATGQDPVGRIEAAVQMSDDELVDELPAILDAVDGQVEDLMLDEPALFGRVVGRMGELDVREFASDHPETVERFQAMLWTGMDLLVQFSPDVQESIREDVTVAFDATDAPMTGALVLDADAGTVEGFMRGAFTMRGDVNKGVALAETMERLTAKLPT